VQFEAEVAAACRRPGVSISPVAVSLQPWFTRQRHVPDGSATAKAMDYSLNRWAAPTLQ
jgi:hypothetical protein